MVVRNARVPARCGDRVSEPLPTPAQRLGNPDAFLSRSDLRALGLERRAVDAIFRACAVVVLPGYSRPLIRVAEYTALIEACTHRDGKRVR
jgi:hypothetical protein